MPFRYRPLLFVGLIAHWASLSSLAGSLPALRVTEDGRHLETTSGKPFFLLGDTAWELFHRLTKEEAEHYLRTRSSQGYNTIFAVALAEHDLDTPDAYGQMMLHGNDPLKPNEAYFAHVDAVIKQAESLGLYVALLPTWGDKWHKAWGKGPEIFTPENARTFGAWIGSRYKNSPIIWVLGGDRAINSDRHREIIRSMAAGIQEGGSGTGLITFHPNGGKNSSEFWPPDETWLDFNMFQSGHGKAKDKPNYEMNLKNRALVPAKPTLDGEPRYEDHPVRGIPKEGSEWYDDFDVRQAAWWDVLSGSCGHVYGDHNIWQFYDGKRQPITLARTPWPKALQHKGGIQMGHMKQFIERIPWQTMAPNEKILTGDKGSQGARILVMSDSDQKYVLAYTPHGLPVQLKMSSKSHEEKHWEVTWFNPRENKSEKPFLLKNQVELKLTPPMDRPARGNDWALLLELQ